MTLLKIKCLLIVLNFNKFLSNLNDNDINSFNDDLFSDLSSEYLSNTKAKYNLK